MEIQADLYQKVEILIIIIVSVCFSFTSASDLINQITHKGELAVFFPLVPF